MIDATCPLVTKVHVETLRMAREGYEIVLVGHAGHVEVEGTMGHAPGRIHLVQSVDDVAQLEVRDPARLACVTQTTLSVDDTREILDALRARFPAIRLPRKDDICYATQNRQNAVKQLTREADVVIVVGAPESSNSNRLVELARQVGRRAPTSCRTRRELEATWLEGARRRRDGRRLRARGAGARAWSRACASSAAARRARALAARGRRGRRLPAPVGTALGRWSAGAASAARGGGRGDRLRPSIPEGAPDLPSAALAAGAAPAPAVRTAARARLATREIWTLSWPVMLSQALLNAVGLVDIAMVGRIGSDARGRGRLRHAVLPALAVGALRGRLGLRRADGAGDRRAATRRARARALAASLCVSVGSAAALAARPARGAGDAAARARRRARRRRALRPVSLRSWSARRRCSRSR